ncbi:hypothetical protein CRG98_017817 [Punica granatum]|uniref:Reverse transcriptase domain-containing protein n=1 Tax=Punica granatum TaxID=22663 RepID=A0A2I0JZK8_PUNGR|nr:hypothetical protein CRG98_017817 [Punica granatum]
MAQGQRFVEYATKWRAQAAKHIPPISEVQQIQLFHYTLRGVYYSHQLAHTCSFSDLIEAGKKLDLGIKLGRMEGPTSKGEESLKKAPTTTTSSSGRKGKEHQPQLIYYSAPPVSPPMTSQPFVHHYTPTPTPSPQPRPPVSRAPPPAQQGPASQGPQDANAQDNSLPFVIDYTPEEPTVGFAGHMASQAPFVVDIPAREPYLDNKVPWTYEGGIGGIERQFSVTSVTRSGRVYENPVIIDKGKAPAAEVGAVPESTPFPSKRVTEEEAEAFMKIIKASEYKVVEQMAKSPAHISLLALLLSSEPHGEALLRVLTAAQVPRETPPDRIEETVGSIFSNTISFSDDELPSEGWTHSRALHIVCKCNNYIIDRVMIDNGSALNVCPVTTLKQMNVDLNRVCPSKTAVRAFDGSRREVNGEIDLLIDVGPCSFSITFQVLDIPNAFSLLLGRPWIHSAGAVPSSLHQRLKFIVEEKLIMGINRPIEVEEYKNRRGLGFRPSCHEILEACRGNHLHRLAAHYGKLNRGIQIPSLSHFFPGPPRIIGSTLDGTEEIPSVVHIRLAQENEELDNWTSVPRYSAVIADVLHSNPNLRHADSNPFKERLGEPQLVYFGEGLPEDGQVSEIEESLRRLEGHQITSVEPTEEINVGTEGEPRTLKIGTALNPAQRARMIGFLKKYQEEVIKQINAGFLEVCNYSEWVANIVPVEKKDGRVRVCVDYRDLNKASPKGNFPLPHIDVLVDNTARHAQFSFMDGFSGYNQIRMAEEDKIKTTFTTMWGTFCYRIMPFGLKNAGATYQRAMVTLFHDMMHKEVEVYVDDMIANERGIEVDPDKVKAIKELPPPSTTLGQWKTKDAKLVPYHEYLEELAKFFEKISFTYTPRAKNQFADALVTLASMASITKGNIIEPLEIEVAKGPAYCDAIEATDAKP